jgi:alpha-beta hydrolase superfamily lysophospholipase
MVDMGEKDVKGAFYPGTFPASNGYKLATYTWLPACGVAEAKGVVFLLHGVFAHARFEFLDADANNRRTVYEGSIPSRLNDLGMIVVAHDHPAHGLSSGLSGFVNSFNELRDAAAELADFFMAREDLMLEGKPRFVAGMSMGGTVSIEMARVRPDRFDGYILFSPAVRPPDDMFGWWGMFLHSISSVLASAAPKLKVLSLPASPVECIRDAVAKDDLVVKGPMRARVGTEFLRVYKEIEDNADKISLPAVLVVIGETDPIVSPGGIHDFVQQIKCDDKNVKSIASLGHEVLREPGNEMTREVFYSWISERI